MRRGTWTTKTRSTAKDTKLEEREGRSGARFASFVLRVFRASSCLVGPNIFMIKSVYAKGCAAVRVLSFILILSLVLPVAVQADQPVATPLPPTLFRNPDGRIAESADARLPTDAPTLSPQALSDSGDLRIDALLSGYRWPTGWTTLTYSFYSDAVFGGDYYGTATDVHEVSEPVKANVRRILAWYGAFLNIDFVEVIETSAQIGFLRFMLTTEASYARASIPPARRCSTSPGMSN